MRTIGSQYPGVSAGSIVVVLRPLRSYVVGTGVILSIPVVVLLGVALLLVTRGNLAGGVVILVAAPGVYVLLRLRRISLVLDETTVAGTSLFSAGSCRKDDLAGIQLRSVYRGSSSYVFMAKNGSEAFRTDAAAWRRSDIEALAVKLGVPLQLKQPASLAEYRCPVCGYGDLDEPPERNGVASHEICPSCGFEFGVTDAGGVTYATWREFWVKSGMPWWAKQAGQPPPNGWDPREQLKAIGAG